MGLREAIQEAGGLASAADLATLWGITDQRARQIVKHPDFPPPVWTINRGRSPVWLVAEAQAFRDRPGGRPSPRPPKET